MFELTDPPLQEDEKTTLLGFLRFQQGVFLGKLKDAQGNFLPDEQLTQRLGPSQLTLKSLTGHLWFVEDYWRQMKVLGKEELEPWASMDFAANEDADRVWSHRQPIEQLVQGLGASIEKTHALLRELDWDQPIASTFDREVLNVRWVAVHLVEEWSRHLGHADFLREAVDGVPGD